MASDERDVVVEEVGTCVDGQRTIAVRLVCYDGGPIRVAVAHEGKGRLGRIDPRTCAALSALLLRAAQGANALDSANEDDGRMRSGKYDDSPNTKEIIK